MSALALITQQGATGENLYKRALQKQCVFKVAISIRRPIPRTSMSLLTCHATRASPCKTITKVMIKQQSSKIQMSQSH